MCGLHGGGLHNAYKPINLNKNLIARNITTNRPGLGEVMKAEMVNAVVNLELESGGSINMNVWCYIN